MEFRVVKHGNSKSRDECGYSDAGGGRSRLKGTSFRGGRWKVVLGAMASGAIMLGFDDGRKFNGDADFSLNAGNLIPSQPASDGPGQSPAA
jgi:hypothetical protein